MEGLFTIQKTKGKRMSCIACGLYKKASNPKMSVQGKGEKRILLVGDAVGVLEDEEGTYWQGAAGRLLTRTLKDKGIDIEKHCFSIYAVSCLSVNKKGEEVKPTNLVIDTCRKTVNRTIDEVKPHLIIALGEHALYSLIGPRLQKTMGVIHKWRGFAIPDRQYDAWICPIFSPDYVLDNKKRPEVLTIWKQDIDFALKYLKHSLPVQQDEQDCITVLDREKEIKNLLKTLQNVQQFAFDIETTGIKPHNKAVHKIAMTSFSFDDRESFVIPGDLSAANLKRLKRIMENPTIGKIAHNMKFEHTWYFNIYGITVKGWVWDSMQAAHILNNYSGITGLKFQAIVRFGVFDYDSEVSPYLKSKDKGANAVNRIQEVIDNPILRQKMAIYCGVDSLLTYKLAMLQMAEISSQTYLQSAYELTHDGILAFFEAEQQGMRVDVVYIEKQMKRLSKRIDIIEKQLTNTKLIRQWQHIYKNKFNLTSNYQLGYLLYTVNKLKPPKQTTGGGGSTDEESLKSLQLPALTLLLKMRKYLKLRDTYLKGFLREQVDGIMHPSFNLHIPVTYRSSSNNPNFQNMPKRDKESMQIIRKAIRPRKGYQLMEIDFSKLEVSIAACYHKDPTMMSYLNSDRNDMHGDLAQQIFKIPNFDRSVTEYDFLRSATKNGFIFPQFYGDYYVGNAETLRQWIQLPKGAWRKGTGVAMPKGTIASHMISKGISSFDKFIRHLKTIEFDFWNKRFKVYKKWKDEWVSQYQKQGYIDMQTGYRCVGVMRRNEVINYPVQGAAFHCLLWSFIQVVDELKKREFKTKVIGQIHDAIVLDVYPPEREKVYKLVTKITTKRLLKQWKWIVTPLTVDAEICDVDMPWSRKQKYVN